MYTVKVLILSNRPVPNGMQWWCERTLNKIIIQFLLDCVADNRIAFINNKDVALKIAKDFHKKSQVMYYDFAQRPMSNLAIYAMTGYTSGWITLRDNRLHSKSL